MMKNVVVTEEFLRNIQEYMYLLSNRVGEVITEYDWRECAWIETQIFDLIGKYTRPQTSGEDLEKL